jgi:ATP phosphoribosyltransferase regulatory subunit HisZ
LTESQRDALARRDKLQRLRDQEEQASRDVRLSSPLDSLCILSLNTQTCLQSNKHDEQQQQQQQRVNDELSNVVDRSTDPFNSEHIQQSNHVLHVSFNR